MAHRLQNGSSVAGRVLGRHRIQRARSAERCQGAVGAQSLPAFHAPGPGILAHRRRTVRDRVRRGNHGLDRRQPPVARRELGVRDGRRIARRQLDLGIPFFRSVPGMPRCVLPQPLPAGAVPARRVHRQAPREGRRQREPLPVRRRGPRVSRLLLPARPRRATMAGDRPRDRRAGDLSADHTRRRGLRSCHGVSPVGARGLPHELRTAATARRRAGGSLLEAARAHVRVRSGLHQARRTFAAHRRCRRWARADPRFAADDRSSLSAVARRRPVRPRRLQVVGGPMLGRDLLAAWPQGDESISRRGSSGTARLGRVFRRRFLRAAHAAGASHRGLRGRGDARPGRPRAQRHSELRAVPERVQCGDRLRRLSVHRLA